MWLYVEADTHGAGGIWVQITGLPLLSLLFVANCVAVIGKCIDWFQLWSWYLLWRLLSAGSGFRSGALANHAPLEAW